MFSAFRRSRCNSILHPEKFFEKVRKNATTFYGTFPYLMIANYIDFERPEFVASYILAATTSFLLYYKILPKIQEEMTDGEDFDYDCETFP
jgi:hypothetical protein